MLPECPGFAFLAPPLSECLQIDRQDYLKRLRFDPQISETQSDAVDDIVRLEQLHLVARDRRFGKEPQPCSRTSAAKNRAVDDGGNHFCLQHIAVDQFNRSQGATWWFELSLFRGAQADAH